MIFESLETGQLMVNCYIIGDEKAGKAVVVDPGGDADQILMILSRFKLKLELIIVTHAHPDHVGGNAALVRATGAPIACHKSEAAGVKASAQIGRALGIGVEASPEATRFLEDGDVVEVGSIKLKVLHIPGHSPGHICLVVEGEKKVVVGDVLFQMSVGRTDFPGCSHRELIGGIRSKLLPLGDDFEVYPGHGPPTKIGYEKKYNPFINGDMEMD